MGDWDRVQINVGHELVTTKAAWKFTVLFPLLFLVFGKFS